MHNSPWRNLKLYLIPFLISHDTAIIILLRSEFENAIIVHQHCFFTCYIFTSPIDFLLILKYHKLSINPRQYLPHSTGFLDIELAIHGSSKVSQDDRRLKLC